MLWSSFKPEKLSDMVGNEDAVASIRTWALDWNRGKKRKPLLVHGPTGTGKTAVAYAVCSEMDWDILEMNASDTRSKGEVERLLGNASTSSSLFGKLKLILIDDVDGLQAKDRGGAGAILSIAESSRQPVIITATDYWHKSLSSLRRACQAVEFKKVNARSIASLLSLVADKHGASVGKELIDDIARQAGGDVRSALNDFQASALGVPTLHSGARDHEAKIFDSLRKLFKTGSFEEAREVSWSVEVDHDLFKLWIDENIPLEYKDPREAFNAFTALSRADVFDGRIRRRQHWGFLRYSSDLMTAGVALAKQGSRGGFVKYSFPRVLRLLSSSRQDRSLRKAAGARIGEKAHCSSKRARDYFELVRVLCENGKAKEAKEFFSFEDEELAFVLGKSVNAVQKLVE